MLSDALKEIRKRNKETQAEMAEKLGVTQRTIANWEGGQRNPDIDMVLTICKLYNVSADYLLGIETEHKEERPSYPPETQYAAHLDDENEPITKKRLDEILAQAFAEYEKKKKTME